MIDAMLLLILGIIIFALGYLGKAGKYKTLALVVGGLMVLGGAFYPAYGVWEDTFEWDGVIDTTGADGDYFSIALVNGSQNIAGTKNLVGVVSDDDNDITFQLNSDGTHTLDETHGGVNFTFVATPPAGTSGDDIVTITATINDDARVGSNFEVFDQTDNEPNVNWSWQSGGADSDGAAIIADSWNDFSWAELRFELDSGSADTFADIYDEIGEQYSIDVTFASGSWSETHTLYFYVITDS
jgi:hypothetical protein